MWLERVAGQRQRHRALVKSCGANLGLGLSLSNHALKDGTDRAGNTSSDRVLREELNNTQWAG